MKNFTRIFWGIVFPVLILIGLYYFAQLLNFLQDKSW